MVRRWKWAAALAALMLVQLATALPAQAEWADQTTSTTSELREVECPTADRCYAVGIGGTIIVNRGVDSNWDQTTSVANAGLYGLACTSSTTCIAVGDSGGIYKTTNEGASWSQKPSGTTQHVMDVSCPSASECFAVGHAGTILASKNGGDTWTPQGVSVTTQNLFGISCPTTNLCWAVGANGTIVFGQQQATGPVWTRQSSGTTEILDGISCATASSCRATGANGTILGTDTAGVVWTQQTTPTAMYLFDVECVSKTTCWAVGSGGRIVSTLNGGVTWDTEPRTSTTSLYGVGCYGSLCKAVGAGGTAITRGGIAAGRSSADCDAIAGATTVADGYAGAMYARIKYANAGSGRRWVCFRFDNGSTVNTGGLVEVDADVAVGTPSSDGDADSCSTTLGNAVPGPHPLVDFAVGDPAEPPYVPVKVDTFRNNEAAWVCLRGGAQNHRVKIPLPDAQVPTVTFFPDAPGNPPPDDPPAEPSGTCQASGGDRVLNMDVATTHIWLYTLRPALNQARVCVRGQGPASAGGMLSVNASAGVPVSISRSQDTTPCTTEILQSNAEPKFRISRTPGPPSTSNPASICVDQGSTHERVTVDTTGSLVVPSVTWTPDAGTPGG